MKNKKVRTKLKRVEDNRELFNLVDRGLKWLEKNTYHNPILKWNTLLWVKSRQISVVNKTKIQKKGDI